MTEILCRDLRVRDEKASHICTVFYGFYFLTSFLFAKVGEVLDYEELLHYFKFVLIAQFHLQRNGDLIAHFHLVFYTHCHLKQCCIKYFHYPDGQA